MKQPQNHRNIGLLIAAGIAGAVLVGTLGAISAHGIEGRLAGLFSANFSASDAATVSDTGLPQYPGSHIDTKDNEQQSSANISAMLGKSGFKLAVVSLISTDTPEKVAPFYRHALARYGMVADCTRITKTENSICNKNRSDAAFDLRAGEKKNQHITTIEKSGSGSKITLVFVRLKGL